MKIITKVAIGITIDDKEMYIDWEPNSGELSYQGEIFAYSSDLKSIMMFALAIEASRRFWVTDTTIEAADATAPNQETNPT